MSNSSETEIATVPYHLVLLIPDRDHARAADHFAIACGITMIAIVVGVVIRNMTDTLLVRQNALFFWGAVGALLAWGRQRAATASPPSSLSGPGSR